MESALRDEYERRGIGAELDRIERQVAADLNEEARDMSFDGAEVVY